AEHEIGEGLVVAVRLRCHRELAEEPKVVVVASERWCRIAAFWCLVDQPECLVSQVRAHGDAFATALAVDWVDEDPEQRGLETALRGDIRVLPRLHEMRHDAGPLSLAQRR